MPRAKTEEAKPKRISPRRSDPIDIPTPKPAPRTRASKAQTKPVDAPKRVQKLTPKQKNEVLKQKLQDLLAEM